MAGFDNFQEAQKALIEGLKGKKAFAIGYHPDADGIAATAILIKYLLGGGVSRKDINLYPVNNIYRTFELDHFKRIIAKKYDAIVCIDYAITTRPNQLYYLSKRSAPVIYIDHHGEHEEQAEISHIYINPTRFPQLTQPQLFTCSKLMNSLFYDTSNDWLELTGLDGDVAIQSIEGSPFYEASRRLNIVGLVKKSAENLTAITERNNLIVGMLYSSADVHDFLRCFDGDAGLRYLYNDIIKDIKLNVDKLKEIKETISLNNNKVYLHKIISPSGYEIAEHVLKAHLPYLGYNETFLIYLIHNDFLTIRVYSSNSRIDCGRIAHYLYGGGHKNRAGITEFRPEDLTFDAVIEMMTERIKDAILNEE